MDTCYFEEFVVLAELQKYADAAERLSISEPSLSRHIKALESELGVTLFDRTSRRVSLNCYGSIFLPYARQFLSLQHAYLQELQEVQLRRNNTVIVGTLYPINDLISRFYNNDSNVSVITTGLSDSTDTMVEKLRSGKCELAFLLDPFKYENEFVLLPMVKDRYVAALPSSHPLASRKSLHLRELKGENFVSFMEGTSGYLAIKDICGRAGFTPRISFNAETGEAIASYVGDGMGVSLLFERCISRATIPSLALIPLEPEEIFYVCLCYNRNRQLSDAAAKLVEYVKNRWPADEATYNED